MEFIQVNESADQASTARQALMPRHAGARSVPRPGTPEQLEALRRLVEMLTRSLDLDEVLRQVRRAVIEVLGFDRCGVWLVDEEQGIVEGRWGTDREGNLTDERHRRLDLRETWHGVGLVAQGRQPLVYWSDFERFARQIGKSGSPVMAGVKENAALAMRIGGRVVGVISVDNLLTGRPFGLEDLEAMWPFVDVAAAAVANARLYEAAEARYRELRATHERLVQSERLRALGEMGGAVAHHFNNTLAIVLGNAELALRPGVPASEVQRRLQTIARVARGSADIVKRVQQFARQGDGMPRVPVDLAAVAEEALAAAQPLREVRAGSPPPITLRWLFQPSPPLLADPMELRQALIYLIENAVEAMPEGGTLTLQTAVEGQHAVLRVSDTGTGIPTAVRHRIFEPFFTTRPASRSGLGLSVTYGILTRHQGTVEVESQEGIGSTFTLRFPLKQTPAQALPAPDVRPASHPAGAARVLVVEDDPLVREVVESTLASEGYGVAGVTSAEAALVLLNDPALGLVVTDHGLPGMSGTDLARAVKAVRPELPVVMLTGWSADLGERAAVGVVDLLLAKPIAIRSLQEAVRKLCGQPS